MKVLLTSGGTRAMIDEVRHVGNMSSGTFGNHICVALLKQKHHVDFLYAKGSKCPHEFREKIGLLGKDYFSVLRDLKDRNDLLRDSSGYWPCEYDDFYDYESQFIDLLSAHKPQVVILAAAVSDYAPVKFKGKISSELDTIDIKMEKTPKIIRNVKKVLPETFLVGFKLLVNSTEEQLYDAMIDQMEKTGADMVVGNDLRDIKNNNHKLNIIYKSEASDIVEVTMENMSGACLANKLVEKIELVFGLNRN